MSLALARLWIGTCAWLVLAGWTLSAVGALNRGGYAFASGLGIAVLVWRMRALPAGTLRFRPRRFRRGWPLGFAVVFAAVLLGGILYFPANYDALSYRIPRVLHWLAEERWHWIDTEHVRLNTRATDVEWIMAPVLLFLRSERWVWLGNAAMLALLPGLIYSAYTAAGGRRRVAWSLMWLLPSGYVFVVQAGGDSNDLPGAFFALAAVALAFHARRSGRAGDLLISLISLALAIGSKVSNAPLALVWLVAAAPSWRLAQRSWWLTAGAAVVAAVCSFLPNAILNVRYCGEWSGASKEFGESVINAPAWVHLVGNGISLTVQNLTPPVFPLAGKWNALAPGLVPPKLAEHLAAGMDEGEHLWTAYEIPTEDSAALGPFLVLLVGALAIGALASLRHSRISWNALARIAPWIAFGAYLLKMSVLASGRLSAPYYLLLPMALISAAGAERVTRMRWWRGIAWVQLASALLVLVISPARPLWPALTLLERLPEAVRAKPLVQRATNVYARYRVRADALAPVRALLPADAKIVALVSVNDLEASLWRPFGSRRFVHYNPLDGRGPLDRRGIDYVVVSERTYLYLASDPHRGVPAFEQWIESIRAEITGSLMIASHVSEPPYRWYVMRLQREQH